MFKNYFKVALRNILKHKFFSAINIFGMTVGIASCLFIILYIADEFSYDRMHVKADRIYQVGLHGKIAGQDIKTASTCPPMAGALANEFPEVESSLRLSPSFGKPAVKYADKSFTEEFVIYTDSNFFDFFSFKLIEGKADDVLREPNTLVLTESMAKKYFGDEPAMGKILVVGTDNRSFKVTGIAADCPSNSHFKFNILISGSSREDFKSSVWLNNYLYTYFLLKPNTRVDGVNAKYETLVDKYVGPEVEKFMGMSIKEMKKQGGEYGYFSTPITDIHLHSVTRDNLQAGGNMMYIYFFGGIGVFILVIACINFMNLSTARSAGRAKEVGLRKTLGSLRGEMIRQFLSESIIYSAVAVGCALVLCYTLLPQFNLLSGKSLEMSMLATPPFIMILIILIVFVGLIAGSYPAFYLTSFNAVEVLKGKVRAGMRSKGVRSFLVVFQFAISIFLIIFTTVVYQQISLMQEKNTGMDKDNILVIQNTGRLGTNKDAFKNALGQQTGVLKVSYTNNTFPGVNNTTVFKAVGSEQDHIMGQYYADYDHQEVMKFEMKDGRFFSKEFGSDSTAVVINEAAVKEFGFTNAVGEQLFFAPTNETLTIVGVMKDFNFESFKEQVRPLSIRLTKNDNTLLVRYTGNAQQVVQSVETLWKQNASNEPFEYTFLDQEFDNLFRAEQRMGVIFSIFSGLAIFIASLGLFALAAFTSEQRTKEIGIRKAMGATVFSLALLLSKEFTKLVLFAFLPAALMGWYVSNEWLNGFVYRTEVSLWIIVGSGAVAIAISWLTVSYQSIKAAATNPVTALRYE
jgi:putative ABC transport system permease protein